MEKKITKRAVITAMLEDKAVNSNVDYVSYLQNELAILDRKNANRKNVETETQKENKELMVKVLAYIKKVNAPVSIATLSKEFGKTSQKITPIAKKLELAGNVSKTVDKRTSLYTYVKDIEA